MPSVLHPELLPLPAALSGARVVLRTYREGDGAAFFAAVDHHRADLQAWLGGANNERSWRLLARCGFVREAHLHQSRRDHHGRGCDTYLYAVTSDAAFDR